MHKQEYEEDIFEVAKKFFNAGFNVKIINKNYIKKMWNEDIDVLFISDEDFRQR